MPYIEAKSNRASPPSTCYSVKPFANSPLTK
jgi:hypothetical protein